MTRLSLAETEKIFAVRKVLEGFAVEEAARLASPQDIEFLQKLFMEIVDAARSQDSRKFVRSDLSFHEKIWQITANEYLQSALRRVVVPLFAFSSIRLASHRSFDLLQDANTHLVARRYQVKGPSIGERGSAQRSKSLVFANGLSG